MITVVAVLPLVTTGWVPAASAKGPSLAEGEEAVDMPRNISLVVAPITPTLEITTDSAEFRVALRNDEEEPLEPGVVSLALSSNREAPVNIGEDGLPETDSQVIVAEVETNELAAGEEAVLEFTVSQSDLAPSLPRDPGVYTVSAAFSTVESESADESDTPDEFPVVSASTDFVWGPITVEQPMPYTLIVPLVLPERVQGIPTRDDLATTAPALLALLTAAEEQVATIAVDPRILVGTRGLGDNAPASARELVERLEARASSVFLLQLADADVAAQAALGFEQLLEPLGFDYVTQFGSFQEPENTEDADSLTGTATPDDSGEADALGDPEEPEAPDTPVGGAPTLTELMALEGSWPGAWPAAGEANAATLALLERSGLTTVVLDESNVREATATHVTLGSFDAIVTDHLAREAGAVALAGSSVTERTAGLAELAARLARAAQSATPSIVVALDRGAVARAADPTLVLQLLQGLTFVQPVAEQAQPRGTAQLRAGEPLEERRELLRATVSRSGEIDALSPLLSTPEYLLQFQRVRLLSAFATEYAAPDVSFLDVDARIREEDERLLQGVQPITTDSTQLVGASTRVPIRLTNALPFEATVSLRATATSATISVEEHRFEAVVPADGNTSVLVPVRSRVSSGEAGLLLEVRNISGERVFASALQPLTLRAAVETIMLSVLGAATVLLLGFGVWRSVRRRHTAHPGAAE